MDSIGGMPAERAIRGGSPRSYGEDDDAGANRDAVERQADGIRQQGMG